ncbi:MAG: hypothetical protein ACK5L5_04520 [Bacteroidales bacterium]
MKKIIGILGVFAIAMTMFFSTTNSSGNTDLASLIAINTANAESDRNACDNDPYDQCVVHNVTIQDCDPSWFYHTCTD